MEDVERPEAHYEQGRVHYRHRLQILLQCLYQGTKSIFGPPDDPR